MIEARVNDWSNLWVKTIDRFGPILHYVRTNLDRKIKTFFKVQMLLKYNKFGFSDFLHFWPGVLNIVSSKSKLNELSTNPWFIVGIGIQTQKKSWMKMIYLHVSNIFIHNGPRKKYFQMNLKLVKFACRGYRVIGKINELVLCLVQINIYFYFLENEFRSNQRF